MNHGNWLLRACCIGVGCLLGSSAISLEVITKDDIVNGVVTENQLVRLADNAIFLIDTSDSMDDEFEDRGMSKLNLALSVFKERNEYFPEIGHQFGVYQYTPWKVVYPVQTYDRERVAAAFEEVSTDGRGATPLASGLEHAEEVIKPLTGRTVLFVLYDGSYTGRDPEPVLWRLVRENDLCIVIISSAQEEDNAKLQRSIARLNSCSRLIPLDYFLDRPEYVSGALFELRATERVVTSTKTRIVGLEVEDIVFGFDKTELTSEDRSELDELAEFMVANPESYAVLAGYTDNVGIEDYNEHLSRLRAEMVAEYLATGHGIDESRFVLHWHGSDNPIADNATEDGRAQNRRVEIAVAGV